MRLSALAFICFVLFSATSVIAQEGPLCAPRDRIAELIRSTFGEVLMAQAQSGSVIAELYVDPDDGSWSVVTTNSRMVSCLIFGGENWTPVDPPLPGQGA